MKLANPVTVKPSKYTNNKNEVVDPQPMTMEELKIIYQDNPSEQKYSCSIHPFQAQIFLFEGEQYTNIDNITKAQAQERLLQIAEEKGGMQSFLQGLIPRTLEEDPHGPGTILASMFSAIGIKSTPTCSCRRHALEMNKNGIEWCEGNIETICGWLQEECKKRSIPYVDTVAKMIVNRAINKAKKYAELDNETV